MQKHYSLRVRPGLLGDGTFAVYAIPDSNPAMEYQLDGQFSSSELAMEVARRYQTDGSPLFDGTQVALLGAHDIQLDSLLSSRTEDKHEKVLLEELKNQFTLPRMLSFRPFARITEVTPHALSIFTLIVFFFWLSVRVPSWIPLIGDSFSGKTLGREQLATYFPILLLVVTIFLQFRVRFTGLHFADLRDHLLALVLRHGWRRDKLVEVYLDAIESSRLGWARKLGEWYQSWDPDTLRQVRKDITQAAHGDAGKGEVPDDYRQLENRVVAEDFEARIHALYYLQKEKDFKPSTIVVQPLLFLMQIRRAVNRLRAAVGGQSQIAVALTGLFDFEERIRRKMFPFIAGYEVLLLGVPLVWSFAQRPWSGTVGSVGMCATIAICLGPMLVWNYNLLVRSRGIPRAMPLDEIQGDQRLIRGL